MNKSLKRTYRFTKKQLVTVQKIAKNESTKLGREVCGLLIDNGYFLELVFIKNKARSGGTFAFDSGDVRKVQYLIKKFVDHNIVGTFHSHPVGLPDPSPSDIEYALDNSLMLIFDVTAGSAKLWRIRKKKASLQKILLI